MLLLMHLDAFVYAVLRGVLLPLLY